MNAPLPLSPVTRWGTWIKALFYAENWTKYVEFVEILENDSEAVDKV